MAVSESPQNRTLRAEIDLPNTEGKIRPGMNGTVTITLQEKPDTLAIPRGAFTKFNGGTYCFRVINGRAVFTNFRSGDGQDPIHHEVEVVGGLKEGEIVIVNPGTIRGLESGQPVESVLEDEAAGSQPRS